MQTLDSHCSLPKSNIQNILALQHVPRKMSPIKTSNNANSQNSICKGSDVTKEEMLGIPTLKSQTQKEDV